MKLANLVVFALSPLWICSCVSASGNSRRAVGAFPDQQGMKSAAGVSPEVVAGWRSGFEVVFGKVVLANDAASEQLRAELQGCAMQKMASAWSGREAYAVAHPEEEAAVAIELGLQCVEEFEAQVRAAVRWRPQFVAFQVNACALTGGGTLDQCACTIGRAADHFAGPAQMLAAASALTEGPAAADLTFWRDIATECALPGSVALR